MLVVSKARNAGTPLSVTRTVTVLVLGPCASVGVQLKTPEEELIPAPEGAPGSRLKLSACAGRSGSLAVAVKVSAFPPLIDLFPIGLSTGGALTSFTVTVIVSESFRGGEPLSVTRMVMG